MTPQELQHQLSAFIGTSRYYRHICGLILTDGAKFFADEAGAYWFK